MKRYCNRCDTAVVYYGVSSGYSAVCPEHDEDLYLVEMYLAQLYVGATQYNQTMNEQFIECPQCGDTVIEEDMREVGVCWECDYLPEEK